MDLDVGRNRPDQASQSQVLDDHRIDPRGYELANRFFDLDQLAGKDQRVQGHVAPDTAAMEERHHFGQVGAVEVTGADARVESLQAEIDGVGAVLDRGDQASLVAGRCQEFGLGARGSGDPNRQAGLGQFALDQWWLRRFACRSS